MRYFFILLLLASCSSPYYFIDPSPKLACIHLVDREGFSTTVQSPERLKQYAYTNFLAPQAYQKVMCVYEREPDGSIRATMTSYFPNGQVKQALDVLNSRACGSYQEWHENGVKKLDCQVIGGQADLTEEAILTWLFDGCCRAWDACANPEATILYEKGVLEGESLYFYPSGGVKRRSFYVQGFLHGEDLFFTETGELLEAGTYVKGAKEGTAKRYWSPTQPAAEELFDNGKLIEGRYFNSQGEEITAVKEGEGFRAFFDEKGMRQLQQYQKGVAEGELKTFDAQGRLYAVDHMKNGKRHGESLMYFPIKGLQLQPRLSICWYEDKIHGLVKTWYENGAPESQREMSNNVRNGLSTSWYRDGSVMMMEQYDHDKLIKGEYFRRGERQVESRGSEGTGVATLFDSEGNLLRKVHYFHSHILD